jgi:ribosome biogenesis GTPase
VLAHFGQASLIETGNGSRLRCLSRRTLPRTVSGDRVSFERQNPQEGVITGVAERRTTLVRRDPRGRLKPVAANVDRIVVVIAARPSFASGMLDRYLVAAEIIGADPVLVVNKADLLSDEARARLEQRLSLYSTLGYHLVFTSTRTADGLKTLHAELRGHTSILVGQSGVGKSSLVQALLPDIEVRIGDLSRVTGLGRHTTTTAMLYHLPDGGDLIDSPGVRDFSLWPVDTDTLARGFVEFRPLLGRCRFNDCKHHREPGCALTAAVRDGRIQPERLASYHKILKEFQ